MSELSPAEYAAYEVWEAARGCPLWDCESIEDACRRQIAAALRAVAEQGENLYDPHEGKTSVVRVERLLAIATELEAQ